MPWILRTSDRRDVREERGIRREPLAALTEGSELFVSRALEIPAAPFEGEELVVPDHGEPPARVCRRADLHPVGVPHVVHDVDAGERHVEVGCIAHAPPARRAMPRAGSALTARGAAQCAGTLQGGHGASLRPTPDLFPFPLCHTGGVKLLQIAQYAEDLDRAADFYTVLLETTPAARFDPPGLLFFDLGGTRLLLDRAAPSALIYLRVANVHETLERLGGLVEVVTPPHVIFRHDDDRLGPAGHDEWQAFIRDSEGNTVALVAFQLP